MDGAVVRVFWLILFMLGVLWAMISVTPVLWPAALAYGMATAVAALEPDWVNEALGLANAVLLVSLMAANRALGIVKDGLERRRQERSERAPPE